MSIYKLAVVLTACLMLPACNSAMSAPPPPPTFTVLYSFTGGGDGAFPTTSTLTRDGKGNFYGTTLGAGNVNCNASLHPGCGTVWRLDGTGNLTVLHTFSGGFLDVGGSSGSALDANGNLFGSAGDGIGPGLVFEVDKNGSYSPFYDFAGGVDGDLPTGNLILDAAGNAYGTTLFGGSNDPSCSNNLGCGTVFELGPTGLHNVLYSFLNNADGAEPYSVIRDSAGNLFGATYRGGGLGCAGVLGCGTIFELDAAGNKTLLHAFTGGSDGSTPAGNLVMDAVGNLYGTTSAGGDLACPFAGGAGCGVVFRIDTHGVETVLHAFHGGSDGNVPVSVVLDGFGNLIWDYPIGAKHQPLRNGF